MSKDTAVAHHKKVYYIQICFNEKDLNDYNFFLIAGKFNLIFMEFQSENMEFKWNLPVFEVEHWQIWPTGELPGNFF